MMRGVIGLSLVLQVNIVDSYWLWPPLFADIHHLMSFMKINLGGCNA